MILTTLHASLWPSVTAAAQIGPYSAEDFTDETGISLGDSVELRPASSSDYGRSFGWSHSTTVPWVQARREVDFGVASDQWIYVGTVQSDWYFGDVHGFYNTETQVMRNIFECT